MNPVKLLFHVFPLFLSVPLSHFSKFIPHDLCKTLLKGFALKYPKLKLVRGALVFPQASQLAFGHLPAADLTFPFARWPPHHVSLAGSPSSFQTLGSVLIVSWKASLTLLGEEHCS